MPLSFGAGVRDSLSNLAAALGTGRDKAAHDAFAVFDLGRAQIEGRLAEVPGDRGTAPPPLVLVTCRPMVD